VIKDAIEANVRATKFDRDDKVIGKADTDVSIRLDEGGKISGLIPYPDKDKEEDVQFSCCHADVYDDMQNGLRTSSRENLETFSDSEDGQGDLSLLSEVIGRIEKQKGMKPADMKRCFSKGLWEDLGY